jgi:hypothetical protein
MREPVQPFVRNRALGRCEYCQIPERFFTQLFHIEHIVARSHGGSDDPKNLALACGHCNLHKGPNLSGVDPDTGELTRLFHPRTDTWEEHFTVKDGAVVGLSSIGRTTAYVLAMNTNHRIAIRQRLGDLGIMPFVP